MRREPRRVRRRRRAEPRDALTANRLERPRAKHGANHLGSGSRRCGDGPGHGATLVALGHRHDDEIRAERAVVVEVPGDELGLAGARRRRGPCSRRRREESQHRCRRARSDRARAWRRARHLRARSTSSPRPPGRRRSAGSRSSRPRRREPSRGGPSTRGDPHARARAALRWSARRRSSSGSAGPPRPIATTTTFRSADSCRARCPVTAVFPTRFPVPITARVGCSTGAKAGGSKRKSAPSYGDAERKRPRGEREPLDRARAPARPRGR